jgi:uncharacterized protein YndB with AHSA1/START domain
MNTTAITIEVIIDAPIEKFWDYFTTPDHVMQWNQATDDWHPPIAANDLITWVRLLFNYSTLSGLIW